MEQDLYKTPIKVVAGEDRYVCPLSLVLNTYIGCQHECVYCYAKYILEMEKQWHRRAPADVDIIRNIMNKSISGKMTNEAAKCIQQRIPFRFSNLTDPFQQMESKYRATFKTMEIMAEHNYPVVFNVKGVTGITTNEYMNLFKEFPNVFQYTIIVNDDKMAKKLEPGAPSTTERLKAMKTLSDNGFITQLRYSPVFPGIYDEPDELFRRASEAGCKDVICEQMRVPINQKQQTLINDALGFDYLDYLKEKGYPMIRFSHWYKLETEYRFKKLQEYKDLAKSYGMDFTVCSEERPQMNNWKNCCNTDKYGLNSMSWSIQKAKVFEEKKVDTFMSEYGQKCPFKKGLREFFNEGKFCNCLTEHQFKNGVYTKKPKKY